MVSTTTAIGPTVAQLQTSLIAHKARWLTTYPHMSVSFTALADLVHEILTVNLAAARSIRDELVREIVILEAELAEAQSERDQARAESDQREQEVIALTVERDRALARVSELESDLDTPGGEA